jgi:uncharacterized protein YjlB
LESLADPGRPATAFLTDFSAIFAAPERRNICSNRAPTDFKLIQGKKFIPSSGRFRGSVRKTEVKMSQERVSKVLHPAIEPRIITRVLKDDGTLPNSHLPVLFYQQAALAESLDPEYWEDLFRQNNWRGGWRDGIYNYHHYHSTSHEVLGAYKGAARVQLGGDGGIIFDMRAGDVFVIPAGVAHKNLGATSDFAIVGAYPDGRPWDLNYGKAGERPKTDNNIAKVPLPRNDPLYGPDGPLTRQWGLARKHFPPVTVFNQ